MHGKHRICYRYNIPIMKQIFDKYALSLLGRYGILRQRRRNISDRISDVPIKNTGLNKLAL